MMRANRWDFERERYDEVDIPETCCCHSSDMDRRATCPGCGGEFRYGDMYTSRRFHTGVGFGYAVCEACYAQEFDLERTARARREAGADDAGE